MALGSEDELICSLMRDMFLNMKQGSAVLTAQDQIALDASGHEEIRNSMQRLWDFAVNLYGQDQVALICIDWQDRFGLDITMLLHACWVGVNGRTLDADQIKDVDAAVRVWRTTAIKPLRDIRRDLKQLNNSPVLQAHRNQIREMVKSVELEAEHYALNVLEEFSASDIDLCQNSERILDNILIVFEYFARTPASVVDLGAAHRLEEASLSAGRGISL